MASLEAHLEAVCVNKLHSDETPSGQSESTPSCPSSVFGRESWEQASLALKEGNSDVGLETGQTNEEGEGNDKTASPNHDRLPKVSNLSHESRKDSQSGLKDESGSEDKN